MDIESQLLDLCNVPLKKLTELDDPAFAQMLRLVVERTSYPQVTAAGACSRVGIE